MRVGAGVAGAAGAALLAKSLVRIGVNVIGNAEQQLQREDIANPPDGTEVEKDPDTGNYIISKNPVSPVEISLENARDHYGNILPIPVRSEPVANEFKSANLVPPKKDIYGVRVIGGTYESIEGFGNIRPIDPNHPGIELAERGLWFELTDSEGRPVTIEGELVDLNDKNSKFAYVAANFVIVKQITPQKLQ